MSPSKGTFLWEGCSSGHCEPALLSEGNCPSWLPLLPPLKAQAARSKPPTRDADGFGVKGWLLLPPALENQVQVVLRPLGAAAPWWMGSVCWGEDLDAHCRGRGWSVGCSPSVEVAWGGTDA